MDHDIFRLLASFQAAQAKLDAATTADDIQMASALLALAIRAFSEWASRNVAGVAAHDPIR